VCVCVCVHTCTHIHTYTVILNYISVQVSIAYGSTVLFELNMEGMREISRGLLAVTNTHIVAYPAEARGRGRSDCL
jgi:hypothetical protein